ncbi:hypothetical protein [Hyphococcus sp.]|jgi:hypothetical protein|uniref:hypothetical protein n=1 Tax=Hyphococcus sp. TaxID=2038636 RepID=UPI003D0CB319
MADQKQPPTFESEVLRLLNNINITLTAMREDIADMGNEARNSKVGREIADRARDLPRKWRDR